MRRPIGVTILAAYHLLLGAFRFSLWAYALRHPQAVVDETVLSSHLPAAYPDISPIDLIFLPISAIVSTLLGAGLFFLIKAARGLLMFLTLVAVVRWPVALLFAFAWKGQHPGALFEPLVIVRVAINAFIYLYLSRDDVKEAFHAPEPKYADLEMIAEEAARESPIERGGKDFR